MGTLPKPSSKAVLQQARERSLLSDEHFTVDGTLTGSVASVKSYQRKDAKNNRSAGRSWQCEQVDFHGEKRVEPDARIEDGPGCEDGTQRQGQRSEAEFTTEICWWRTATD